MSYQTILVDGEGPVATVRLNRPERMNAVIEQMYHELRRALASAAADRAVRVLVLTGSVLRRDGGDKQAFCAGADLKEHATGSRTAAQRRAYIELAHATTRELFLFPKPVIAAVNGPARGAGAEMALSCDFLVMAEEATIAFPETGLGTFVGGGVTLILPQLVGLARAKELIFGGRVLDGRQALALGLATRVVPLARLAEEVAAFAEQLAAKAPHSMRLAKQHLQRPLAGELEAVLQQETEAILECMETADWMEGVRAFRERRQPRFKGE
jgi:enoyl-CoA hydratase